METIPFIDIRNFKILKSLGCGSFGLVYLVQKIQDLSEYASKTMKPNKYKSNTESFNREIISYSKTDNPAIIAVFGYSQQDFEGNLNPTLILKRFT